MKKLVLNPLKSSIISSLDNLIQNRELSSISKIFIMRHAESHFNSEIKKLDKKEKRVKLPIVSYEDPCISGKDRDWFNKE
jgi:hypothetical protein